MFGGSGSYLLLRKMEHHLTSVCVYGKYSHDLAIGGREGPFSLDFKKPIYMTPP